LPNSRDGFYAFICLFELLSLSLSLSLSRSLSRSLSCHLSFCGIATSTLKDISKVSFPGDVPSMGVGYTMQVSILPKA
jgi:hypothetical protein